MEELEMAGLSVLKKEASLDIVLMIPLYRPDYTHVKHGLDMPNSKASNFLSLLSTDL